VSSSYSAQAKKRKEKRCAVVVGVLIHDFCRAHALWALCVRREEEEDIVGERYRPFMIVEPDKVGGRVGVSVVAA
jgi:hypothetical protein